MNVGAKLAYLFEYGDEWRVMLTLRGGGGRKHRPAAADVW